MPRLRKTRLLAERWFKRGRQDLETAELLFREHHYTDTICYFSHQAIEKYLKGYLVFKNIKPPYIHDLVKLLQVIARVEDEFNAFKRGVIMLNKYYIATRYPIDFPVNYPRSEARTAIEIAKEIIKFINKIIFKNTYAD